MVISKDKLLVSTLIILMFLLGALVPLMASDLQEQLDFQQLQIWNQHQEIRELEQQRQGYSPVDEQMKLIQANLRREIAANEMLRKIYLCCDGKKNYCNLLNIEARELGNYNNPFNYSSCTKTRNTKYWKKYKETGEIPTIYSARNRPSYKIKEFFKSFRLW